MEKSSVTCDKCEKQLLVTSSYPHEWGLKLTAEDYKVGSTGMTYAVLVSPPIQRDHHFCSMRCLFDWISVHKRIVGISGE